MNKRALAPEVVFFTYNLGSYSGAARQAHRLTEILDNKTSIINIGIAANTTFKTVDIHNVTEQGLSKILPIMKSMIRCKARIAHFHGLFPLAMIICMVLGRKLVLKTTLLGDDDFDSIKAQRFGRLKLALAKRCNANIVLSERQRSINKKYINPNKIYLIPNGVSTPEAPPKKYKNSFCYVGLICPRKNTTAAITFFHRNYKDLPDGKLYIVGPLRMINENEEYDAAYVESCMQLVDSLGIKDQVFFTGQLDAEELENIYRESKALLLFSHKEGLPNVVLECMAQNCVPVISTMDGVAEEIVGNDAGVVCDPDRILPIATIENIIANNAPHRRARDKFGIKSTADSVSAVYQKLSE